MDKVLSITDRLAERRRRRQAEEHRFRAEAVQRMVHCASCQLRCAMCGRHAEESAGACPSISPQHGMNLCESCRSEFETFLQLTEGGKASPVFWHNREWRKLWEAWLDFQRALRDFRVSTEFEQLSDEIDS